MASSDENERSRERSRRGDRGERVARTSERSSRDRSRGDRGGSKKSTTGGRVYVSNIPYEYRWQDLKDLFRTEVGDVQYVELFMGDNDKPKGCGIVDFADQSLVKKCLEVMQRFEVKGRKLFVKEDTVGSVHDKHGNSGGNKRGGRDEGRFHRDDLHSSGGGGGGGGGGDDKWGNTYGLSPSFLDSLRIDVPLGNKVFVANLEYNVDKKKLKEVFRLAGKIQRAELQFDKDGRSRGFAVVEYDHPVEAVQAISMFHNQYLFDRQMTVRMDRGNELTKLPEGLKGIGMGLGSNGEPLKDVARNLPSNNPGNNNSSQSNSGGGILGAVPNQALQVANALSSMGQNAFGNLGANGGMLQANLAGVNSLLSAGLGATDLSFANSLNSLVPNQNQLAALTAAAAAGSSNQNLAPFGRAESFQSNSNFSNNLSSRGGFSNNAFDSSKSTPFNFANDRDGSFNSSSGGGSGGGGGGVNPLMRSGNLASSKVPTGGGGGGAGFSRKVIVSNLPPSASYKMLHDKFSEFGDVQHFEEKSSGTMLVMYGSEWQAERAIKNLDRARIDGRTIDARYFY